MTEDLTKTPLYAQICAARDKLFAEWGPRIRGVGFMQDQGEWVLAVVHPFELDPAELPAEVDGFRVISHPSGVIKAQDT